MAEVAKVTSNAVNFVQNVRTNTPVALFRAKLTQRGVCILSQIENIRISVNNSLIVVG